MSSTKRLCVFVFYDRDGIVDDYVLYLLKELATATDRIAIVCNGEVQPEYLPLLKEYDRDLIIRENSGYDAAAYKEMLEQYLKWEKVLEFDELVLVNDTFYGPFVPFTSIFESMERRDCDFWGLTAQGERKDIHEPYHIQSYFYCIRKKLLHNPAFQEFWRTLRKPENYQEDIEFFELRLTKYFQDLGFKSDVFCDTSSLGTEDKMGDYNFLLLNSCRLLKEFGLPIITKKVFSQPINALFRTSIIENIQKSMEYVGNYTSYDVQLTWKHLIRVLNPKELADLFGLTYILPHKYAHKIDIPQKRIAVLAHIYYNDPVKVDMCFSYLCMIPITIDIYITTSLEETKELIVEAAKKHHVTNYQIIMIGNRGREIRGMLVECADLFCRYEYLCFVHDKKTTANFTDPAPGESFMYLLWDNLLKSEEYIKNILYIFEQNPHLGLLAPIPPYHWRYYRDTAMSSWSICFDIAEKLAESLHLNCSISKDHAPLTLGTAYWCRTAALRQLAAHGFRPEDFPAEPIKTDGTFGHAIERIFSFVAQSAGYATGLVMNEEFAALHLSNYQECVNLLCQNNSISPGSFNPVILSLQAVFSLYSRSQEVYIYGAGEVAVYTLKALQKMNLEAKGCLVSDGHKCEDYFYGHPVWEISELELDREHTGIILALGKKNQKQVLPKLLEMRFKNIYLVQGWE